VEKPSRYVRGFAREWAVAEERGDVTSLEGVLTGEFGGVGPANFKLNKEQWLGRFARGLSYESFALKQG
jgi:hypothetical protein